MAVREPLVLLPAPRALRFRPPLSSLLPIADAVALGSVCPFIGFGPISRIGFRPIGIVFAVLTFLILNSASSRAFRINPRLGDDAAWLLGRVALSLLLLVSVGAIGTLPLIDLRSHLSSLTLIAPLCATSVIIARAAAYACGRAANAPGGVSERTLIVGHGALAIGRAN